MPFEPEDITGVVEVWVADDLALSDGAAVSAWAGRVAFASLDQATGSKQPAYRTSGINSQPAVDFDGTDDLLRYAAANALSTAASGHVFIVVRFDSVAGVRCVWSSADEATTTSYVEGNVHTTGAHRVQQNSGAGDDTVLGSVLATATDYLLEWQSSGTAWALRVNGTTESLSVDTGANSGDWFGDVSGRDNFVLGSLKRTTEAQFTDGKIAAVVVVDGSIGSTDRTDLEAWVTAKYGITFSGGGGGGTALPERQPPRGVHRGVMRGVA